LGRGHKNLIYGCSEALNIDGQGLRLDCLADILGDHGCGQRTACPGNQLHIGGAEREAFEDLVFKRESARQSNGRNVLAHSRECRSNSWKAPFLKASITT